MLQKQGLSANCEGHLLLMYNFTFIHVPLSVFGLSHRQYMYNGVEINASNVCLGDQGVSGMGLIQSLNLSVIEVFVFLLFLIKSDSQQFNVRYLKGLKIEVLQALNTVPLFRL